MLLMIDNYDSFTYNLVQYFGELGQEVQVVRNDALTVAEIAALGAERIVISPGPCTPDQAGVSLEVLEKLSGVVPILGVCLGHQSLGQAFGLWLNLITDRTPQPMPVPKKFLKHRNIMRSRNNQYFSDPRHHQYRQRIIDHGLIIQGHELLTYGHG